MDICADRYLDLIPNYLHSKHLASYSGSAATSAFTTQQVYPSKTTSSTPIPKSKNSEI